MDDKPNLQRRPKVCARTGLSATQIDALEKDGKFPRRVPISARAVGWVESEVTDYIRSRIALRDARQAGA